MTPLISHEERSSVITHESTPSVSIIIALEHRSRVKRTSFESESERRLIFCILYERDAYVCNRRHHTLLLLLTSRRCQRRSATPMLLLFNRRTKVPEPWLIFRLGVPPISSEEKTKKKCQIMFLFFLPDNWRQINLMETRGITLCCSRCLKTALLLSLTLGG